MPNKDLEVRQTKDRLEININAHYGTQLIMLLEAGARQYAKFGGFELMQLGNELADKIKKVK